MPLELQMAPHQSCYCETDSTLAMLAFNACLMFDKLGNHHQPGFPSSHLHGLQRARRHTQQEATHHAECDCVRSLPCCATTMKQSSTQPQAHGQHAPWSVTKSVGQATHGGKKHCCTIDVPTLHLSSPQLAGAPQSEPPPLNPSAPDALLQGLLLRCRYCPFVLQWNACGLCTASTNTSAHSPTRPAFLLTLSGANSYNYGCCM